jgi:hypothetical protein
VDICKSICSEVRAFYLQHVVCLVVEITCLLDLHVTDRETFVKLPGQFAPDKTSQFLVPGSRIGHGIFHGTSSNYGSKCFDPRRTKLLGISVSFLPIPRAADSLQ